MSAITWNGSFRRLGSVSYPSTMSMTARIIHTAWPGMWEMGYWRLSMISTAGNYRDINTRTNTVIGRFVNVVALTDANEVVLITEAAA